MLRIICGAFCIAIALSATSPATAQQKKKCPEGRTASGECANVALAGPMRQRTIILSQPKLSYRGPAVMPSEESKFMVLRDRNIYFELFGPGGCIPPAC